MKRLGDERGQSMILMLLCMTCLLGFTAFATDVGLLFRAKRNMQIAADSAAIAGAAELNYTDLTPRAAANAAATQNGVTDGSNGATVAVNIGPTIGPHAGNAAYVEVIASQSQPTFFMKLFQRSSMMVSARAVATNGASKGCIYALGTSGTDFGITGNANISAPNCGISINSKSNDALDLTGNITLAANSIGIVGNYSNTGNITVSPTPVTGIAPVSDPLAFLQPPAYSSCTSLPANMSSGTYPLGPSTPGGTICYNGLSPVGNATLNLSPGVYVINGNINPTGNITITGTGVTFYLLQGASLTGNLNLNLSAPTSGAYNGILFYEAPSDTSSINITGNAGSTLKGIIYAPNANVTLTGNSNSGIYADFVVKTLTLVGNASFQDYAAVNGGTPLTSTRLVE